MFDVSSSEPQHLLLKENRIVLDCIMLVVAIAATFFLFGQMNASQHIAAYAQGVGALPLNDLILTFAVSFFYLLVFAVRRLNELSDRITQANTDTLVGTFNRRRGTELLHNEIHRANLHRVPLSVIMLDVDDFKAINDRHGHEVGDDVLKTVIKLARECSRNSDYLIRWGGEEFIVGCKETTLCAADKLAGRIRRAIESYPFSFGERVTASFGVTEYQLCEELEDTLKRVDGYLYESKKAGKNRICDGNAMDA